MAERDLKSKTEQLEDALSRDVGSHLNDAPAQPEKKQSPGLDEAQLKIITDRYEEKISNMLNDFNQQREKMMAEKKKLDEELYN